MRSLRLQIAAQAFAALFAGARLPTGRVDRIARGRSWNRPHYGARQAERDRAWLERHPLHPAHPNNAKMAAP